MPRFVNGEFEDFEEYWDHVVPTTFIDWYDRTDGKDNSHTTNGGWACSRAWTKHTYKGGWTGNMEKEDNRKDRPYQGGNTFDGKVELEDEKTMRASQDDEMDMKELLEN